MVWRVGFREYRHSLIGSAGICIDHADRLVSETLHALPDFPTMEAAILHNAGVKRLIEIYYGMSAKDALGIVFFVEGSASITKECAMSLTAEELYALGQTHGACKEGLASINGQS